MKGRLPSMPFFVGDYLSSVKVKMMTLAERGAYCHLLFTQWQEGRLEKDTQKLARICDCTAEEFETVWPVISQRFAEDSKGRIYNRKVEAVRKEYIAKSKRRSEAGKQGAAVTNRKRRQKSGNADSNATGKKSPPILSSPIPSSEEEKHKRVRSDSGESSEQAVILFPVVGEGKPEYPITPEQVAEWKTAYPGVDVAQGLREMRSWLLSSPKRQKTSNGVPKFVNGWLARKQNSSVGSGPPVNPRTGNKSVHAYL